MRVLSLLVASTALAAPVVRWGNAPLSFEPNAGQAAAGVSYLARGHSYTLSLGVGTATLEGKDHTRFRTKWVGANPSPAVRGEERQGSTSSYFLGNDPRQWHTAVPNYGKVRYTGVYPGIDLVYYGKDGHLEYDWIVAPGADPRRIRMEFEGADRVRIDAQGDLVIRAGTNEYRHQRPAIYQEAAGKRIAIDGRWILKGREGTFQVGAYDRAKELVIDPPLIWATYNGGSGSDYAYAVAVDFSSNTYVTGQATTDNLEAFVTKYTPDGSARLYTAYIGGSGLEEGRGIAVDAQGYAYVTGTTQSLNFPTKNPIQAKFGGTSDAFVTKLNPSGTALVYSTYLGGGVGDTASGIAIDSARNAYIIGSTFSTDFPTVNAFQSTRGAQEDAFVAKINAAGTALVYSTYFGGNGVDQGFGIAVDAAGNAYLTGYTGSTDFPVQSPLQAANKGGPGTVDAFVTKLNPAGSALVYSTYLGGSLTDYGLAIAVDSAGNAYVTGLSNSKDFPIAGAIEPNLHSNAIDDVFVTKVNPAGSALVYSTYLGGGSEDAPYGLALDQSGNVWITGRTNSGDFPLVNPVQGKLYAFDMFVTELQASGAGILFSTYLGGTGSDSGRGIAVDPVGNVHVAGEGTSNDFPVLHAVQTANGGTGNLQDGLVVLLGDQTPPAGPVITKVSDNLVDGGPLVPGGWFWVKGTGLASVQRIWGDGDFSDATTLPTDLDGVEVWVNGVPAPVYFISPGQVNAQAPSNISGSVTVQVVRHGLVSNTLTTPVTDLQPSIYFYEVGNKSYAAALFLDYSLMGDPAVVPGTRKANVGDVIQLYTAELAASPSGGAITSPVFLSGVGIKIGTTDAQVLGAALVAPGQFQVNFIVPPLDPGEYPIYVSASGKTSPGGILFEVGP